MTELYQCEQCGNLMETPAYTESFRGYRETVVLAFCRDCTEEECHG